MGISRNTIRKSRTVGVTGVHLLSIVVILLSLASCQTSQKKPQNLPNLVSRTSSDGKGYPSGRSDEEPYIHLETIASDEQYGRSPANPVKVGGLVKSGVTSGSAKEKVFLNSLRGPEGQIIEYERLGSCCPFETPNSPWGTGLLDVFAVTWQGLEEPVMLYLNMYDAGELMVPQGFTPRP